MINERSRKSDRHHSNIFTLFRSTAIRSKSLESVYDSQRHKIGKI